MRGLGVGWVMPSCSSSFFHRGELRPREVEWLAQGHTAWKRTSGFEPGQSSWYLWKPHLAGVVGLEVPPFPPPHSAVLKFGSAH